MGAVQVPVQNGEKDGWVGAWGGEATRKEGASSLLFMSHNSSFSRRALELALPGAQSALGWGFGYPFWINPLEALVVASMASSRPHRLAAKERIIYIF